MSRCWQTSSPADNPRRYLSEIESIARLERASLIIPVSEETLYIARLNGKTDARVFSDTHEKILKLHDKLDFVRLASSFGLRVPATVDASEVCDITAGTIVKPRLSCGGRGIRQYAAGQRPQLSAGEIAQQRIEGHELSVFCIAENGVIRALSCYQSELRDGAVAVAFEGVDNTSATDWSTAFVRAAHHTGFIAFDFIVDPDNCAWPIECNPRATSGIHLLHPDLIAACIDGRDVPEDLVAADSRRMEFYSCFTQFFRALTGPGNVSDVISVLRSHRDVTWSRNDPAPFLLMMVLNWRLIWRAMRRRVSFAQASVADLEWRAGDA